MLKQMFHVFRNIPFGRETFLGSIYFSKKTRVSLQVYIPRYSQFLMYFENEVVTVDLDSTFLKSPKIAEEHATEIMTKNRIKPVFIKPRGYTASTLPEIQANFDYMCCPRSISDLSTKIGPGHIGSKVRRIINNAAFPVLIPSIVYKPWKSITVFFGGSPNSVKVVRCAMNISRTTNCELTVFTQAEKHQEKYYADILKKNSIYQDIGDGKTKWLFFDKGKFHDNVYAVPHDSLIIVGSYGHGLIKDLFFGSMLEQIQTLMPNSMLIIGPHSVI